MCCRRSFRSAVLLNIEQFVPKKIPGRQLERPIDRGGAARMDLLRLAGREIRDCRVRATDERPLTVLAKFAGDLLGKPSVGPSGEIDDVSQLLWRCVHPRPRLCAHVLHLLCSMCNRTV